MARSMAGDPLPLAALSSLPLGGRCYTCPQHVRSGASTRGGIQCGNTKTIRTSGKSALASSLVAIPQSQGKLMSNDLIRRYVRRSLPIVATLALASPATYAFDFQNDDGSFTGSWDTTLTFGQAWRIESRDCRLIAIADGGCGRSPNIDDGNLNWDTDMFSQAAKILTELSLNFKNTGVFVRASALYDNVAEDTARTPLTDSSKDLVKSYTRLLDAFFYTKFSMGSANAELRLGRQAVSWGCLLYTFPSPRD